MEVSSFLAVMKIEYCVFGSSAKIVAMMGIGPIPLSGKVSFPEKGVVKLDSVWYDTVILVISGWAAFTNCHDSETELVETLVAVKFSTEISGTARETNSILQE